MCKQASRYFARLWTYSSGYQPGLVIRSVILSHMIETADFDFRMFAFIPLLCSFFSYCCGRRTVVGSRKVASHSNAFLCPALKPRLRCVSGELKSTEDFFFDPSLTTSTAQHTPLQYAKKGRTVVRFVLVQSFPHLFFFFFFAFLPHFEATLFWHL